MGTTLGIMVTATTYGQWLRGDRRGWVDEGRILPADPGVELRDRERMADPPYKFPEHRIFDVGQAIAVALTTRLDLTLLALAVQTWHVHVVVGATRHDVSKVTKCFKDAARYVLRPGRPIWTDGYDKRFCFDAASLRNRVRYVERHNEALGFAPRPYPFTADIHDFLSRT